MILKARPLEARLWFVPFKTKQLGKETFWKLSPMTCVVQLFCLKEFKENEQWFPRKHFIIIIIFYKITGKI